MEDGNISKQPQNWKSRNIEGVNNLHKAFLIPFDLYVYNVKSARNAPNIVVASDGTVNGEYPLEAMAQFFKVGKVIDIHVDEVFYDAILITYEESASAT